MLICVFLLCIKEKIYYKNSKINEARFRRLMKALTLDLTVSDAPKLTDISNRSVNTIFSRYGNALRRTVKIGHPIRKRSNWMSRTSCQKRFGVVLIWTA